MYFNEENNNDTNLDKEFNEKKPVNINMKFIIIGFIFLIVVVIGFFLLKNIFKKEYFLVLAGDNDIIIKQNALYEEPGYQAYDNKGNDFSSDVTIIGEVNTFVVGEYKITYSFNDIVRERTVVVVPVENQVTYLILTGARAMFIKVGDVYQEPGYTVIDNLEDNLTNKVTVSGKVDTNTVGTYKLLYSVTNKSGKTLQEERTIIVTGSDIFINYTPTDITNKNVTINLEVTDNYFDYIMLPDNTKVTTRTLNYQATENNTYKFLIYSKDGSNKEQIIKIDNIDKVVPTGTCSGYYKDNNSYITVSASDNIGVYKYVINNKTFTANQIVLSEELKNVKVDIYDKANNVKSISCNLIDKNVYPSSSSSKPSSSIIYPSSSSVIKPPSSIIYPSSSSIRPSSSSKTSSSIRPSSSSKTSSSIRPSSSSKTSSSSKQSSANAGNTNAPTNSQAYNKYLSVNSFTSSYGKTMSYWLYVPDNVSSNMPMIVFLHGSGEAGNDYRSKTTNAITWGPGRDIRVHNTKFNAIIVMPQANSEWDTNTLKSAVEIANSVASKYSVNRRKISIVGFSLGCIALADILKLYPNYFSAVVPIECKRPTSVDYAKYYTKTPVWTFASQDYTHTALQTLTDNINKLGGNAKHSYYPGKGHTGIVGNNGYSIFRDQSLNLVSWLTSKTRS